MTMGAPGFDSNAPESLRSRVITGSRRDDTGPVRTQKPNDGSAHIGPGATLGLPANTAAEGESTGVAGVRVRPWRPSLLALDESVQLDRVPVGI
jgi:hypothetical protein